MPSVEKRRTEIIRDQMKQIDAAQRREKMKFNDFELVASLPEHFKVKGIWVLYRKFSRVYCVNLDPRAMW